MLRRGRDLGRVRGPKHLDRGFQQVSHDRLDITPDVSDFGELGCFDLDERSVHQLGEASSDFGLANPGRADHDDVSRHDFSGDIRRQLHSAPTVANRDRNGVLGFSLADDVLVQRGNDVFRGSVAHGRKVTFTAGVALGPTDLLNSAWGSILYRSRGATYRLSYPSAGLIE